METIWQTLRSEMGDLSDLAGVTRVTVRLLIAAILGGILGYEREKSGKSAGMRTHMLVSLGAAIFVLVPLEAGTTPGDLTRVLQGLVAGIGFIGAGAIMKSGGEGHVLGLTTAANIWLTAGIGMTAGMGRELTAILSTLLALVILAFVPHVINAAGNVVGQTKSPEQTRKD